MTNAANAILVKSRAKFGKSLKLKDYDNLLSCPTMKDVVAYLKSNTKYRYTLDGLHDAAVHRGNLEVLLKKQMYTEYANLCSFERSIGEHYFEYLLLKAEIEQILMFFRYFSAGKAYSLPFSLPDFFKNSSKVDAEKLSHAQNFNEALQILKNTRYHKILVAFKPKDDKTPPDFTLIESALDKYMYSEIERLVNKHFSGHTKDELFKIFGAQAELDNIRKIYRSKKYHNFTNDELKSMLNHGQFNLSGRVLNQMIESEDYNGVYALLNSSKYKSFLNSYNFVYIDDFANRFLYNHCRRKIHFSKEPAVVMASAILLTEIEIYNITNIIEGKRYQVDANTIKQMLILDRQG